MNSGLTENVPELSSVEARIVRAVRELSYGAVEVVVHDGRVTELRQTRRTRFSEVREFRTTDRATGG